MKITFYKVGEWANLQALRTAIEAATKNTAETDNVLEAYNRVQYPDDGNLEGDPTAEVVTAMESITGEHNGVTLSINEEGVITMAAATEEEQDADTPVYADATEAIDYLLAPETAASSTVLIQINDKATYDAVVTSLGDKLSATDALTLEALARKATNNEGWDAEASAEVSEITVDANHDAVMVSCDAEGNISLATCNWSDSDGNNNIDNADEVVDAISELLNTTSAESTDKTLLLQVNNYDSYNAAVTGIGGKLSAEDNDKMQAMARQCCNNEGFTEDPSAEVLAITTEADHDGVLFTMDAEGNITMTTCNYDESSADNYTAEVEEMPEAIAGFLEPATVAADAEN